MELFVEIIIVTNLDDLSSQKKFKADVKFVLLFQPHRIKTYT